MSDYFESARPVESFAAALRHLAVSPGIFFAQMPRATGYSNAVWFLSITLAVPLFVWTMMSLGMALFLAPLLWLVMLAGTWLWAWYLGWAVRLFAGRELSTVDAFHICAYANAPALLAWVPVLNVVIGIWSLILEWFGLTRYAGIGSGTALLILIVPMIVLMLSVAVLAILVGMLATQHGTLHDMQMF